MSLELGQIAKGQVQSLHRRDRSVQILTKLSGAEREWSAETPAGFIGLAFFLETWIVAVNPDSQLPGATDRETFRQSWSDLGIDIASAEYLVVRHGDQVRAFDLFSEKKVVDVRVVLEPVPKGQRLDSEHRSLESKKVAIIGCGSLGSKVATSLARSGVGHFVLVDDDIALAENFVRNELDWRDIGLHKVDALGDKLAFVNLAVKCEVYRHRLGGQESGKSIETLLGVLSECDLLIDATADAAAFNYLCAVAKFGMRSMLWGEVFGGGFGGLIARSRWDIEPDPATMRQRILSWCRENGREIQFSRQRYEGVEGAPAIADDPEVSALAAQVSMLAVDTLIPRVPSVYPYAVYLLGFRAEWIFEQPFDTRPIDIGPLVPESPETVTDDERRAEVLRLLDLSQEHPNANTRAS